MAGKEATVKASKIVEELTYCDSCAGHDPHDTCSIRWYILEDWIASVEDRLSNGR